MFLADDHPIVLRGARAILEANDIRVVGEARSTDELLSGLKTTACDVAVTDFVMPGGLVADGTALIQQVRQEHPLLPLVVMTMIGNIGILDSLLRAGLLGLIEKTEDMDVLPIAVRSAASRRVFVSPGLRSQLSSYRSGLSREGRLSPREIEVVRMLAAGQSVSSIAERLGRSVKTISRQKMDAMRKLGLENDAQLYAYARDHRLI
ncbi:response regulator transcription factor [Stenotrophomonas sp. SY1]|uniref:response regulator transcription factor n=1 Tax=Stenotrophomonas sp. SY1 TaxID=477235 RepID=UPI001E35FA78|nr:response regulator transcription factor [Stenotrophomonas sp. SY1]